jgi:hypothetical protein
VKRDTSEIGQLPGGTYEVLVYLNGSQVQAGGFAIGSGDRLDNNDNDSGNDDSEDNDNDSGNDDGGDNDDDGGDNDDDSGENDNNS